MEGSHVYFNTAGHIKKQWRKIVLSYYFYIWQIKMAMLGCSVAAGMLSIVFLLCCFISSHMQYFRKCSAQRFALK